MKKKYIIGIIIALFILADLFVLLYPTVGAAINARRQLRVVAQYFDDVAAIDDGDAQRLLEEARAHNESLLRKTGRFRFTHEDTARYMELLNTGRGIMGVLAINKLDVKLPVYHGTDAGVLQVGLGHMQGTSLPVGGNGTHAFITGHRGVPSSMLLTDLDKMAEGDTFVLYVLGETLTYLVDNIQTVEPHVVEALDIDPDKDYCTLVTCTPYGINTHRLLVRGHRVENAAVAGWEAFRADAKRLDRPLVLLLFMPLTLPIFMLCAIHRYRKIRKGVNI